MKRLFSLLFKGEKTYFISRSKAKNFKENKALKDVKIRRGPDHWKGESDGTFTQTSSSKKEKR